MVISFLFFGLIHEQCSFLAIHVFDYFCSLFCILHLLVPFQLFLLSVHIMYVLQVVRDFVVTYLFLFYLVLRALQNFPNYIYLYTYHNFLVFYCSVMFSTVFSFTTFSYGRCSPRGQFFRVITYFCSSTTFFFCL